MTEPVDITVTTKAAAGFQVGKTVVKFKDVEVGKVTAIRVADDLKSVQVTAELVAGTERWLTQRTRFRIARPRVAAGRVSGLDTLFSGAFIDRGQQVGQVVDSRLDDAGNAVNAAIAQLVTGGLRGQLQSRSLLTGQLYVELGFHPDAPPASITEEDGYQVVPTVATPLDAVAAKVKGPQDTFGRLPLEEIAAVLRDTIEGITQLVNSDQVSGLPRSRPTRGPQRLQRADAGRAASLGRLSLNLGER